MRYKHHRPVKKCTFDIDRSAQCVKAVTASNLEVLAVTRRLYYIILHISRLAAILPQQRMSAEVYTFSLLFPQCRH